MAAHAVKIKRKWEKGGLLVVLCMLYFAIRITVGLLKAPVRGG